MNIQTIGFDGNNEIIFSQSFNVYENKLVIPDFLGRSFKFIFETSEPEKTQKDIDIVWEGNEATVTISKKFRNVLGSGNAKKLTILRTGDQKEILLSIFGQQIGTGDLLNVTVNFYQR